MENKLSHFPVDFNAVCLKLASPENILNWSYGEVTKPETINYRTGRSERGGLFDERIFGPDKDYECYCGKYRRIRYKNIICERCGVEVTNSVVRRERMGHIELAGPVAHIWFVRGVPSRLGMFLNLTISELEKVIYFAGYIVTKVNPEEKEMMLKEIDREYKKRVKEIEDPVARETLLQSASNAKKTLEGLMAGRVLDEVTYHRLSVKYATVFEAAIGAEALYKICEDADLDDLLDKLKEELTVKKSPVERLKIQKRYNLIRSMKRAGIRPEWLFLTKLPVIPPGLRPMVALDGGRYATSDVNDLYRRIINRNNRLKKLKELDAPDVILRNEKRILQEAVDALIDNSMRRSGGSSIQARRRELRSLSDNLKGKQGRFRQNLLGKRVDYSGRSVIVVGPQLRLNQCGLPKLMALELFRPFIIAKILEKELAFNIRGAGRLIDEKTPEVWAILEEVIKDKYVLLNRAPTLHRLGIQAFKPILIEGSAIEIHPLVCTAFNADFDGDQMAVHVPLSAAAQREARELMSANTNLFRPGSGNPIVNPKLDVVLGTYWVTRYKDGARGAGRIFSGPREAVLAFDFGEIDIRAKIKVLGPNSVKHSEFAGRLFETSAGRIMFNEVLPPDLPYLNKEIVLKDLNEIVEILLNRYPPDLVTETIDRLKDFGFAYATFSGVTWGLNDIVTPAVKNEIVAAAHEETAQLEDKYNDGLLSSDEKYRLTIKVWTEAKNQVERAVLRELGPEDSVSFLFNSGARGSLGQIVQMGGMKGLIVNPAGSLIEFPVIPSYKDGLSPLEYFITTHGSRKTLTDTALNTAKAGYLTRRLVYVAENIVISQKDCGDTEGKVLSTARVSGFDRSIARLVRGRFLTKDVKTGDGKLLFSRGSLLSVGDARIVEQHGVNEVAVRTVFSCRAALGVCQACYGLDLGRGRLVEVGEPVGIVAAQAIGEPGTQLTMRTKHTGGVDVGLDIVGGLPRVEEIFERRKPQNPAAISSLEGVVSEIKTSGMEKIIVVSGQSGKEKAEYSVPPFRDILVRQGDAVRRGQFLTDGPADLQELHRLGGKDLAEEYIIDEINKIYELQGEFISRKHLEIIVRQMFSRRRVKDPGDTHFEYGEVVEDTNLTEINQEIEKKGGRPAAAEMVLLGISEVALTSSSFLAAVSFAQATRVLIRTAVRGGVDKLFGAKENVMIGRLIPAGTGLRQDYAEMAASLPAAAPFPESVVSR